MGDGPPSTEAAAPAVVQEEQTAAARTGTVSCTKYFDALWFCYSPVHQLNRYYVHGDVDDCVSHWSTLVACLKQKTRFRMADEDEALPTQPCMWSIRSPAEARASWTRDFPDGSSGHSNCDDATTNDDRKTPMA